jgi:predicted DsbA family dithiol-disulfide isomerase
MVWWRTLFFAGFFFFSALHCLAADLMDEYLSVPGSYMFVRRAPEGAHPDRVVMTVFEDFFCPACYRAATDIFPTLKAKYDARLELHFIGFPLVHAESRAAARAYAIAHELGFGEDMQKALFRGHFEDQLDLTSRDSLAKVADSVGIASDLFLRHFDSGGGNAEVDRNITQADSYKIDATPTVIFDGWIKVDEISSENLATIIDGIFAKKKLTASPATKPASKERKAAP